MTKIVFKKLSNGGQISILKATINSFLVQMDKYWLTLMANTVT